MGADLGTWVLAWGLAAVLGTVSTSLGQGAASTPDDQAKKLASTDAFSQDLYKQIQNYAETNGFSLVLNLKSSDTVMNAVLWYSPMIDITSDVIQALTGKAP